MRRDSTARARRVAEQQAQRNEAERRRPRQSSSSAPWWGPAKKMASALLEGNGQLSHRLDRRKHSLVKLGERSKDRRGQRTASGSQAGFP